MRREKNNNVLFAFTADEEVKWQYPYHKQMMEEKMMTTVGDSDKYTPLHGIWSQGKAPTKTPAFLSPWPYMPPEQRKNVVSTCLAPYKSENYTHKCSDCHSTIATSSAIHDVIDIVVDEYVTKLHVTYANQSTNLLNRIADSDIVSILEQYSSIPPPADLKTWIFIPTAGRAKSACLNLKHSMRGPRSNADKTEVFKTYVQVLVVQEKDFQEYCSIWGSKVAAILQLPSKMRNDDRKYVSAVDGGIGYSRRFIHLFAKVLRLDHIFMIDDRVWFFQEVQFTEGKVKREEDGKVEFKCVPFFKVLSHLESQFESGTPKPRTDFYPYQPGHEVLQNLSELESYTGPYGNYAALGVRKARKGSERVKKAFKKVHVYSLYLLNVKSTKEKNVTFNPWEAFDDIDFNERSDRNDLWVCKYNRFLLHTKRMHSAPVIFLWNEEIKLTQHQGSKAENEAHRLARWINFNVKPKWKRMEGSASPDSALQELFQKVNEKKHEKNSFFICLGEVFSMTKLKNAIKRLVKAKVRQGLGLYIIAVPTKMCLQHSLKQDADFTKMFHDFQVSSLSVTG